MVYLVVVVVYYEQSFSSFLPSRLESQSYLQSTAVVVLIIYADLAVGLIASDARPDLIFLERTRRRCDEDDVEDVVFDMFRLLLPNFSEGGA